MYQICNAIHDPWGENVEVPSLPKFSIRLKKNANLETTRSLNVDKAI